MDFLGLNMQPSLVTPHGVLLNADCLDLLRALPSDSLNMIFADPPFNIGKEYNNGLSDLLSTNKYLDWCRLCISESVRVVKPGGAIFIYNLPRWAYQLAAYLEEQQMDFRHWIAVSMKGTFPPRKQAISRALCTSLFHERNAQNI